MLGHPLKEDGSDTDKNAEAMKRIRSSSENNKIFKVGSILQIILRVHRRKYMKTII